MSGPVLRPVGRCALTPSYGRASLPLTLVGTRRLIALVIKSVATAALIINLLPPPRVQEASPSDAHERPTSAHAAQPERRSSWTRDSPHRVRGFARRHRRRRF